MLIIQKDSHTKSASSSISKSHAAPQPSLDYSSYSLQQVRKVFLLKALCCTLLEVSFLISGLRGGLSQGYQQSSQSSQYQSSSFKQSKSSSLLKCDATYFLGTDDSLICASWFLFLCSRDMILSINLSNCASLTFPFTKQRWCLFFTQFKTSMRFTLDFFRIESSLILWWYSLPVSTTRYSMTKSIRWLLRVGGSKLIANLLGAKLSDIGFRTYFFGGF